jgi:hypothetical protein
MLSVEIYLLLCSARIIDQKTGGSVFMLNVVAPIKDEDNFTQLVSKMSELAAPPMFFPKNSPKEVSDQPKSSSLSISCLWLQVIKAIR